MTRRNQLTLADKATRGIAVATVAGLAALAARISYQHMLLLAERSQEFGLDAHAFPLTVDGLDLIGVLVLLADRRTGRRSGWLPWAVLTVGSLASVVANIAVAPDNPVARGISGWSAITVLAAAKMLAHLFEPTHSADSQAPDTTEQAVGGASTSANGPDDLPTDTVGVRGHQRRRVPGDAARRVPTSDAAKAKWTAIWQAIQHLNTATPEVAQAHGVSLRTLQFIRAAGQEGHLQPPDPQTHPQTIAAGSPLPPDGDPTPQPNHQGTLTGAPT